MFFPISNSHISPIYLVVIGFLIGVLGGFFRRRRQFHRRPRVARGRDWTGISPSAPIWRTSSANRSWRQNGIARSAMSICGSVSSWRSARWAARKCGAQLIQMLKRAGNVNFVVSIVSIAIYVSISSFMIWEAGEHSICKKNAGRAAKCRERRAKQDESSFSHRTQAIQRIQLWPMVSLPTSGVKAISLWVIVLVSFIGGLFSGFLGGGAGYIRMPMMVYVLGIPTHLAVGTDLFEIIISASYGTFQHAHQRQCRYPDCAGHAHRGRDRRANRRHLTQYFAGPKIRLAFVPLPLIGAAIVIYTLVYRTQTLTSMRILICSDGTDPGGQPDAARRTHRRVRAMPTHAARHCRKPERRRAAARALESEAEMLSKLRSSARNRGAFRRTDPRKSWTETTANEYDLAIIGARRKGSDRPVLAPGKNLRGDQGGSRRRSWSRSALVSASRRILVCTGGKKYIDDAVAVGGRNRDSASGAPLLCFTSWRNRPRSMPTSSGWRKMWIACSLPDSELGRNLRGQKESLEKMGLDRRSAHPPRARARSDLSPKCAKANTT